MSEVRFTLEDIEYAMEDYVGFCTKCGSDKECCEPDAREVRCDECGEFAVFGAPELLFMGLVD